MNRLLGDATSPSGPPRHHPEAPGIVHEVLSAPGQPLPSTVQAGFSRRFGRDFSGVRVHTGGRARESADAIDAQAYTAGDHVVLGDPHRPSLHGESGRVLAHELVHVAQWGGRPLPSQVRLGKGDGDAERQADRLGSTAISRTEAFAPTAELHRLRRVGNVTVDGSQLLNPVAAFANQIPAESVYDWPVDETGAAWPMHQDRGLAPRSAPIREHAPLPRLSPWISPTQRREWDPNAYEEAVARNLETVTSREAGRVLLQELTDPVTIHPFPQRDPVRRETRTADREGEIRPPPLVPEGTDVYRPNAGAAYAPSVGLIVSYTPGHFPPAFRASSLFHEFVHIVRRAGGLMRLVTEPARHSVRYTEWEEFPAVVMENVFRSQSGLPLRWGHFDVTTPLENPDTWLHHPHNRAAVLRIIQQMPDLTRNLARVSTGFNPFARLYGDQPW